MNDNSQRLLDFCVSANLRICGSWYCRKNIHRFTWLSNDHKTAKEIDHVLVNRRWNVIKNCRVYRKLEFNTDHRPVIATCCLKLKKQPATSQLNKRYNVSKLLLPDVQYQYQVAIQNRFSALADRSGEWDTFKHGRRQGFRPGWAKFGAKRRKKFFVCPPWFSVCPPCHT